jgi:hypothetical protein
MNKYYRVNNHGNRVDPLYSIDEVTKNGNYICQVAFFYRDKKEAFRNARRIIAEDLASGINSAFQPGKEHSVCGWIRRGAENKSKLNIARAEYFHKIGASWTEAEALALQPFAP